MLKVAVPQIRGGRMVERGGCVGGMVKTVLRVLYSRVLWRWRSKGVVAVTAAAQPDSDWKRDNYAIV